MVDFLLINNVIHRDIKPDNLIFNAKSSQVLDVRLGDFGIAKKFEEPLSAD